MSQFLAGSAEVAGDELEKLGAKAKGPEQISLGILTLKSYSF